MRSSLFYENQFPRPWKADAEVTFVHNALEQLELADKLGFDGMWAAEHHFLEEYSHMSTPEVFLSAVAARTKNLRIGHGVSLSQPGYSHPARVAEKLANLDLISRGRVEWGFGASATLIEMEGFGVDPNLKTEMSEEGATQSANMMAMNPYPGYEGKYFSMPCRNIVPKPVQAPHPPMWMACSRRESIVRAARAGVGALVFGFVTADQAKAWVDEYYSIIMSDECVPMGHTVNANFATLNGMMVHQNHDEAISRGLEGFQFFGYGLSYYIVYGDHKPGYSNLWDSFQASKKHMGTDIPGAGSIGTPEAVREHLLNCAAAGVDQMIFIQQAGRTQHDHICEAIELYADEIIPALKEGEEKREKEKAEKLAPFIEAALKRKEWMPALSEEEVEPVASIGLRLEREKKEYKKEGGTYADPTRGGAIPMANRKMFD